MKKIMFITFLAVILAACAPAATPAPTETPLSTFTPVPPTTAPTFDFALVPATPISTQPPFVPAITPDAIQVKRWKEYQTALAKSLLSYLPPEEVICEWEILGQSELEVYVWAVCESVIPFGTTTEGNDIFSSSSTPAIIHLDADGVAQSAEVPGAGSDYARDIRKKFPPDVQERILNNLINYLQLSEHLDWRRTHLKELPLIILSATLIP